MIDTMLGALGDMMTVSHLFFLMLGTVLGLLVGVLPGLGGIAGLSILLPFIFGINPIRGVSSKLLEPPLLVQTALLVFLMEEALLLLLLLQLPLLLLCPLSLEGLCG